MSEEAVAVQEVFTEVPVEEAPAKPAPTVIQDLDRMQLINLELQVSSFADKKQVLQAKMEALIAQERLAMGERNQLLAALAMKYRFDPNACVMDPQTGLVTPRQPHQG